MPAWRALVICCNSRLKPDWFAALASLIIVMLCGRNGEAGEKLPLAKLVPFIELRAPEGIALEIAIVYCLRVKLYSPKIKFGSLRYLSQFC